jgi:hypothetical protein
MDTVTRTTGEIAAAKLRLAAAESGISHGEPLQPLIDAMADKVAALHDARQPMREDEQRNAIIMGISAHASGVVQALNWRNLMMGLSGLVVYGVACAAGGYWWHGSQQLIAGVSAGQQECHEQHGGTVCLIPIWTKLPPQ